MEFIIAILLYLNVMVGGGQYTTTQFTQMQYNNQGSIQAVMSDPHLSQVVWSTQGIVVPTVVIFDPDED